MKPWALHIAATRRCLNNTRGLSLLVLVLVLTVAAAAAVSLIVFKVKLQDVQRESLTKMRLEVVRSALQRYYLSHHTLPTASTTPADTIPVQALNLDQQYRLDAQGRFSRYFVATNIVNYEVDGSAVAGVLISLGPDQTQQYTFIDNSDPNLPDIYTSAGDDILVGIPLRAEATKIAQWSVEVLQRAAIAYTRLFEEINNDGTGTGVVGNPTTGDTYYPPPFMAPGPDGISGTPDDVPTTPHPLARPGQEIDEDGPVAATGGATFGCLHFGVLSNDPDNGTASLDNCPTPDSLSGDIVAAYGLNSKYATDPWGNAYQWGNDSNNPSRYHVFFSNGQDVTPDDDIVATERLP